MSYRQHRILSCCLIALATFGLYANALHNTFLLDDIPLILQNAYLRGWGNIGILFTTSLMRGAHIACSFYRPLQNLLYLAVFQFWGASAVAYHLLNFALHAANGCLVYLVGRRLSFNKHAALCAALLWVAHPVQVEAVTYISATADTLYTFFCLAALFVLLPDFTLRKFWIATLLFMFGLLSKETALLFPLLVTATLFFFHAERLPITIYLRTWPLWVVAAIYVVARLSIAPLAGFDLYQQPSLYTDHVLCRIYTFLATLPTYSGMLIWPANLHPERNFPIFLSPWHWQVMEGFLLLCGAIIFVARDKDPRRSPLRWGILWFFAADFLHTGVVVPVNGVIMEHWMYLPTAGLFLGLAETIARTSPGPERRKILAAFALLIFIVLGAKTYQQNQTWRDPETFYAHIFASNDYLPQAHNGLGTYYLHRGEYDKAAEQFNLAIQQSGDTLAESQYDLGITLLQKPGRDSNPSDSIAHFKRALDINPDLYQASHALAEVYRENGDSGQADIYQQQSDAIAQRLRAQFGD